MGNKPSQQQSERPGTPSGAKPNEKDGKTSIEKVEKTSEEKTAKTSEEKAEKTSEEKAEGKVEGKTGKEEKTEKPSGEKVAEKSANEDKARTIAVEKKARKTPGAAKKSISPELEEKLEAAEVSVTKALGGTVQLNRWWRAYLFWLSVVVLFVTFYQMNQVVTRCSNNIKLINEAGEVSLGSSNVKPVVDPAMMWYFALRDSTPEILGIIVTISLILFLRNAPSPGHFASMPFIISCLCVLWEASAFLEMRKIGCVDDLSEYNARGSPRTLPVALFFHPVVTVSHWFMGLQLRAREKDILSIRKLRKDLTEESARNKKMK